MVVVVSPFEIILANGVIKSGMEVADAPQLFSVPSMVAFYVLSANSAAVRAAARVRQLKYNASKLPFSTAAPKTSCASAK